MPGDKCFACFIEHSKNAFESVVVVVRIGHRTVLPGVYLIENQVYFGPVLVQIGMAQHIAQILGVHDKNFVETPEISGLKLPCPLAGNIDAELPGGLYRATVGHFACVPKAGAGTVDDPIEPCQAGFVLHDSFRQRAAANVAETNHEYFHR